ncbi:MAG: response regulator transcription factor [Treponema sp.]|nr:response regulator transcription factor [Treponema sp.]
MAHRFFVVDDHLLTNRGIREYIESAAATGAEEEMLVCCGFASAIGEALEKLAALALARRLPELLVLDLFLGKESGIDLLRAVGEKFPTIKTVVYSMYTNPGIVSLATESGACGFVSKSSSERELLHALSVVLKGGSYIQPDLTLPLVAYRDLLESLTKQERTIFKLLIERKTNKEIADALSLAGRSVENYLSRIYSKTGCPGHEALLERYG